MEHEVEGSRPMGRPKKTWKEVVREDCQARKLNKEDAMDRCKWTKVIKEARWSGWVWVGECFFWYRPTRVVPDQRPLNCRCCCCSLIKKFSKLLLYISSSNFKSTTLHNLILITSSFDARLLLDFIYSFTRLHESAGFAKVMICWAPIIGEQSMY